MTDDEFEQALRESLEARAAVRDEDIRPLRGYVKALPPRRKRRGAAVLAAAAGIVVMLGVGGLLVANLPLGSGGAAPNSRLAVCGVSADDAEAIFQMDHVRDYPLHLPAAYPLVGLQADPEAPALVIVLKGPASPDREGNSPSVGNHDLCMVVGTGEQPWQRVDIVDVDTTAMIAVLPVGTPFPDELAPWAERCGGADARIIGVYPFDHGADVPATLALDPSPPELDTDEPGAVIVYADSHPFPPLGTPPADGATVGPRDPLAPDHHDVCVLVGADPATATLTIREDVGVSIGLDAAPTPVTSARSELPPDAMPLPRTFPLAITDGCDTIGVDNPVTGKLRGDPSDPDLVWLEAPGGKRLTIVWPAGFGIVFEPRLRLEQADGSLVAREGDTIVLQVSRDDAAGSRADPYVATGIMLAGKSLSLDNLDASTFEGCFVPG